jgi:hypothetical protein
MPSSDRGVKEADIPPAKRFKEDSAAGGGGDDDDEASRNQKLPGEVNEGVAASQADDQTPFALESEVANALRQLPPHLRERLRVLKPPRPPPPPPSPSSSSASQQQQQQQQQPWRPTSVLYWMRCAMRATENPSLCCAVAAANALRLPLLVLITLEERHEHATARHHTFILQGAADVLAGLRSRGIPAALHVERAGRRAGAYTRSHFSST